MNNMIDIMLVFLSVFLYTPLVLNNSHFLSTSSSCD